jgi:hypothetical protein
MKMKAMPTTTEQPKRYGVDDVGSDDYEDSDYDDDY